MPPKLTLSHEIAAILTEPNFLCLNRGLLPSQSKQISVVERKNITAWLNRTPQSSGKRKKRIIGAYKKQLTAISNTLQNQDPQKNQAFLDALTQTGGKDPLARLLNELEEKDLKSLYNVLVSDKGEIIDRARSFAEWLAQIDRAAKEMRLKTVVSFVKEHKAFLAFISYMLRKHEMCQFWQFHALLRQNETELNDRDKPPNHTPKSATDTKQSNYTYTEHDIFEILVPTFEHEIDADQREAFFTTLLGENPADSLSQAPDLTLCLYKLIQCPDNRVKVYSQYVSYILSSFSLLSENSSVKALCQDALLERTIFRVWVESDESKPHRASMQQCSQALIQYKDLFEDSGITDYILDTKIRDTKKAKSPALKKALVNNPGLAKVLSTYLPNIQDAATAYQAWTKKKRAQRDSDGKKSSQAWYKSDSNRHDSQGRSLQNRREGDAEPHSAQGPLRATQIATLFVHRKHAADAMQSTQRAPRSHQGQECTSS